MTFIYKLTVTNMEKVRNFDVMCEKFNVGRIYTST